MERYALNPGCVEAVVEGHLVVEGNLMILMTAVMSVEIEDIMLMTVVEAAMAEAEDQGRDIFSNVCFYCSNPKSD